MEYYKLRNYVLILDVKNKRFRWNDRAPDDWTRFHEGAKDALEKDLKTGSIIKLTEEEAFLEML